MARITQQSILPTTTVGGEITRELVNASDGQGLHFDGAAGNIDLGTPPNLGTKFSFEFVIQADSWDDSTYKYLIDFGVTGRFTIGTENTAGAKLAIQFGSTWESFTVSPLADLKVHHIVITVSGDTVTLYDNGNSVSTIVNAGTHNIDACTSAVIGSYYSSAANLFNGTIYRARLWNKTLSSAEVTASYENATVPFADQYGVQGILTATDFTSASGWAFETNVAFDAGNNQVDFSSAGASYGCNKTKTATKVGQIYRTTMVVSNYSGGSVAVRAGNNFGTPRTGDGTFTEDVTVTTAGTSFGAQAKAAGTTLSIDSITTDLIGCVSDYDLAFANPTQSDQVQDRAGAADGTASSGVTQVTKIEAVNTNKLNVGGVTPLVGIGLAAGVTPVRQLQVHNSGGAGSWIAVTDNSSGGAVTDGLLIGQSGTYAYLWNYEAGTLDLATNNTTRLSISSTGLCSFTNGIAFSSQTDTSATGAAATSTTLDHYEEGTWTPTLTPGAGSFTTLTYTVQRGRYIRTGNHVWCAFEITVNAFTIGTGASYVKLSGLPFNRGAAEDQYGSGSVTEYSGWTTAAPLTLPRLNAGDCILRYQSTATDVANLPPANITAGCAMNGFITYSV